MKEGTERPGRYSSKNRLFNHETYAWLEWQSQRPDQ